MAKPWQYKPVNQYNKDWLFVKRYPSVKDAEAETGIHNISAACRGKIKHAGGYHWVFAYTKKNIHPILIKKAENRF